MKTIIVDKGLQVINTPDRLIIETITGDVCIDAPSISEAQKWRDELAKAVNLVRAQDRMDQISNY